MEFGIFIQGYLPGPAAHDSAAEHRTLFEEIEYVKCADAQRVAMLDHLTNRCFEFGTGRGAGSHEVATFDIQDASSTRAEWDEVIREIPRMWECIETFGKHVIPEFDRDPVHHTDRMRATETPKFGPFEHEPPAIETMMTRRGSA